MFSWLRNTLSDYVTLLNDKAFIVIASDTYTYPAKILHCILFIRSWMCTCIMQPTPEPKSWKIHVT